MRIKLAGLVLLVALAAASSATAGEYHLTLSTKTIVLDGRSVGAVAINDGTPGPTLHLKEGEDVTVHVTNDLNEPASIHWHGVLVPGAMDGVPGMNGFPGIKAGETFTYRFTVKQSGTYWYHSHSDLQEQIGMFGAIIIDPKGGAPVRQDRDYVVMLSDFPADRADRVLANLKADSDYYNYSKRTVGDFFDDVAREGLGAALRDRLAWGGMRMSPTDLSDVSGYAFLVNGKTPSENETFLFAPRERVRLRFIAAGAMTYFDVRIPGLKMTVVAADGQDVVPVAIDEFRIAPGETYDVIVEPSEAKAFTIFAQSLDRTGYARATLANHQGMSAPIPPMRPRALLAMSDMPGMSSMTGNDPNEMPGMNMPGGGAEAPNTMPGMPETNGTNSSQDMNGMDMSDMPGMSPATAMSSMPTAPAISAVNALSLARPVGWDSGYPAGERILSYADLEALVPDAATAAPDREIVLHLTGNMQRYIWTLNGKKFGEAPPIALRYGERVKITFVNDTMMAHPMHLHGMYMELINGQPSDRLPKKHTLNIAPGQSASVLVTMNEPGEWAFHCHLFYHMATGMMTELEVARTTSEEKP